MNIKLEPSPFWAPTRRDCVLVVHVRLLTVAPELREYP